MEQNKIDYILKYYSSLMTNKERVAWKHWSETSKMNHFKDEKKVSRTKLSLERGWMTKDEDILKLLERGIDEFERIVAIRIDKQNKIKYNYCPNCGKLSRTPKARQCRFCAHDWH